VKEVTSCSITGMTLTGLLLAHIDIQLGLIGALAGAVVGALLGKVAEKVNERLGECE